MCVFGDGFNWDSHLEAAHLDGNYQIFLLIVKRLPGERWQRGVMQIRGVPALYQSLGGSGKGYPDPSSRLASRVELPKITISVVETSPSEE